MDKVNKKYWVIGILTTLIVALMGTTYAYWRGSIRGNGSEMTFNFDKVYVVFTDNTSLTGEGEIKPNWSVSKTFTIENQGGKDFKYDILIENLINTFVIDGGLQYKITSNNNGYNMDDFEDVPRSTTASDVILAESIIVGAKTKQTYTIEFKYNELGIDQSDDMNRTFSGVLAVRENNSKNLYSTLTNGSVYEISERTDFSTVFGGEEIQEGYNQTGKIYKADSDYYFAGNPSDNWVLFADKWWRIIRTNSDEGTRLLYAGTSHDGQDGYINNTTYVWNSSYNSASFVQWSNYASAIRSALDNWYSSNISSYENMINTDTVYCNDISVARTSGSNQYFGAYGRLSDSKAPSYACSNNGNTTHKKIGLMTADEVAFAGGVYNNNALNTYYYRNSKTSGCTGSSGDPCSVTEDNHWWTISPYFFINGTSAYMFNVFGASSPGRLNNNGVNGSGTVRPVISLKASVKVTGSGTTDDPYVPVSDGSNSKYVVKVSSNDENMGEVNPTSQKVGFGEDVIIQLTPKSGYYYNSNTCGGVVENNVMSISNITDNKECNVTFGVFNTLYATLSDGKKYEQWKRTSTSTYDEANKTGYGFNRAWGATAANTDTTIIDGYNQTGKIYLSENNYYFAGNPSDNWVYFADKWWRIIRTNSSEGTRILFSGTTHDGKDGYINNTKYIWNKTSTFENNFWSKASFVSTLNSWYSSNITGINDEMVNNIVYCNDTSYTDMSSVSGWKTNGRSYGAYDRLETSKTPSHACGTNSFGSASKVGLMTADEVSYAGGVFQNNSPNTYYYRNSKINGCTGKTGDSCSVTGDSYWWTMSPNRFQNGYARMFLVMGTGSPGQLSLVDVTMSHAVRPVITLKPEILVSGSGTTEDPFIPSL